MATFDIVPCPIGFPETGKCESAQPLPGDTSGTKLKRMQRFNMSNHATGTKTECEAYGEGYTFTETFKRCFYPCPSSYEQDPTNPGQCVARPLLTEIDKYYEVLQDASRSCFEKSSAYKKAILESGQDPSSLPFPAECPNPYSCSEGVYADKNDLPPMPDNTDTTVPSNSDPNGTSGIAGAGGNTDLSKYSQLLCKNGQWEPFIPPPPYNPIIDSSGGAGEPSSRLTLTVEEIDKIPLESEYGSVGRKTTLAQELTAHPTLLDVDPAYIVDYMAYVPDFVWSCEITQENFDKMPEGIQCGLVKHYYQQTTVPAKVKMMREYDPTILITRNAPSTTPPVFVNDLETKRRKQCEEQSNSGYGGCKWVGDCEGVCNCPEPPPPDTDTPDAPPPPGGGSPLVFIGVVVGVGVVLYAGYKIYSYASPTGRAMQGLSDGGGLGGRLVLLSA